MTTKGHYELPTLEDDNVAMLAEAEPITVGDLKFEPLTARRIYGAEALGLRAFKLTEEDIADLRSGRPYRSQSFDMMLVLFLCKEPHSTAARAYREPDAVLESALAWADEIDLLPRNPNYAKFWETYTALTMPVYDAATEPVASADEDVGTKKKVGRKASASRK